MCHAQDLCNTVKVGEGVSGERSDYSDGGDVSGDENSDVVVPSVGGVHLL